MQDVVTALLFEALSGKIGESSRELVKEFLVKEFGQAGDTNMPSYLPESGVNQAQERQEEIPAQSDILSSLRSPRISEALMFRPTSCNIDYLSRVLDYAYGMLSGAEPRPSGRGEGLPMFYHAVQVGFLLASSGQSIEVIAAGFMHDLYEGYARTASVSDLRVEIPRSFGQRVGGLIDAVTEPKQQDDRKNWRERKLAVLNKLRETGCDESAIVCASKVSTIEEGRRYFEATGSLLGWSGGSLQQNIYMFTRLRGILEERRILAVLLVCYEQELERWRLLGEKGE